MPSQTIHCSATDISVTRKDSNIEQHKACEQCRLPINIGDLYLVHEEQRFPGVRRYYWHWKCWEQQLMAFLMKVEAEFGSHKRLLDKVEYTFGLIE